MHFPANYIISLLWLTKNQCVCVSVLYFEEVFCLILEIIDLQVSNIASTPDLQDFRYKQELYNCLPGSLAFQLEFLVLSTSVIISANIPLSSKSQFCFHGEL